MIAKNFSLAMNRMLEFTGRSRRSEFWGFMLVYLIVMSVAGSIDHSLFGQDANFFHKLARIGLFLPLAAVSFRRLQDIGRSGWWSAIAFSGIGVIVLIFWWVQDSYDGPNEYGLSPKESRWQGPDDRDFV